MHSVRHTLPREQRLWSKRLIDRLFSEGQGGFVFPVRYVVLAEKHEDAEVCLMVSVPKRHHKRAVVRNRLKRRLREAYRLDKESLRGIMQGRGERLSLALLYSVPQEVDYAALEEAVRRILRILEKQFSESNP